MLTISLAGCESGFFTGGQASALPGRTPTASSERGSLPNAPVSIQPLPELTPTAAVVEVTNSFSGELALAHVAEQLAFGPRFPGSAGHLQTRDFIRAEVQALGWEVETQPFEYQGFAAQNLIVRHNRGAGPIIALGAHYDTRRVADQTPESSLPVPGAVDGASGVAVLLELARALDLDTIPREIWLLFFDVEDQGSGGIAGWHWIAGSTYMAENLSVLPEAVIVVDMIGDADQQLYYEGNSDPDLSGAIWAVAADLGYESFFIPRLRHTMLDDHLPFRQRGLVAIDIIDFDYPYWHTVDDTLDKVSAESLARVGRTLEAWLEQNIE